MATLEIISVLLAISMTGAAIRRPRVGLAMILLSFIPAPLYPTPEFGLLFYGFAGFCLIVLIGWLAAQFLSRFPFDPRGKSDGISFSLGLWLLLCLIGLPLSFVFNEGAITDRLYFYFKGLIPFVFLLIFYVVRVLPFSVEGAKKILDYLLIVAIAFAAISYGIYAVTQARVTWIYAPLQFPFVVLGCAIAFVRFLVAQSRTSAVKWMLLTTVLAFSLVLTFTKALIIVLFGSLFLVSFLVIRNGVKKAAGRVFCLTVSMLILGLAAVLLSSGDAMANFSELVSARLSDNSSTDTRASEWQAAIEQFTESPVIGKGIGFQLERDVLGEALTSGYVHNQTAYAGMTMGVAGLLALFLILFSWGETMTRLRTSDRQALAVLAAMHGCVFTLIAYAQMFATFRTIQHNIALGVLLALIVRLTPVCSPAKERVPKKLELPEVAMSLT